MKKAIFVLSLLLTIFIPVPTFADYVINSTMAANYNVSMLVYFSIFILLFVFLYRYITRNNITLSRQKERIILLAILSAALLVRLCTASAIEGWPNDIAANKYWAMSAAKGLASFYSSGWCDYPPLFIYVLNIIGKLASISWLADHFTLLIKLPSILADLVTAYIIYKVAAKQLKPVLALTAAAAYAFHPAVYLDSTIWGQVDSFFTMIIISALVLLLNKKLEASAILFTAATLMKPQGIFFLPLILFELIKQRKPRKFVSVIISGLVTAFVIIIPFAASQEPLWIFKLYLSTATEYASATMNAFNIFSLFGANFKDGSLIPFLFSYNTWGIIFDIIIFCIAGFIYIKGRHVAVPIVVAMLLNAGAFIFSVKMHERYLFPILALSIMAIIYLKDRRFILLFMGFSATVFFNIHILFYRMLLYGVVGSHFMGSAVYPVVFVFSLLNVLLFAYLVKVSYDILVKNSPIDPCFVSNGGHIKDKVASTAKAASINNSNQVAVPKMKLDKKDWIIMSVMTIFYLGISLVNLGSLKAPVTSWTPLKHGESVVIDLGSEITSGSIYFYSGLGRNRPNTGKYSIHYKDPSGQYQPLATIDKTDGNIFVWTVIPTSEIQARYLKLIVDSPGGTLNEVAFFGKGSNEPVKGIKIIEGNTSPDDVGKAEYLFDEADKVDYSHTFMSGMIFDEIYHARTAFEYLHLMEPYEWTHPPLGKVLISLGILIFGMNPLGWRIIGTLFGVAMVPIMYMFGRKLFGSKFFGFCSAFLMMFDFMHFGLSRIATIDIYGTFFIILMYYYMYDYFINKSYLLGFKKSLKPLLLSGLFFGLGASSKWIGLYAGGGLAFLFFLSKYLEYRDYKRISAIHLNGVNKAKAFKANNANKANNTTNKAIKANNVKTENKLKAASWYNEFVSLYITRTFLFCVLFFVVIPCVIYMLSYIPYMLVPGDGHGFGVIFRNQAAMLRYHSKDVITATHTFSSLWWEWPLIIKPLLTYRGSGLPAGVSSTMTIMGNPAIWWPGIIAIGSAVAIAIRKRDKKMIVVFTAIAFQYLPWVGITRIAFIYHFFSIVPFMILSIVYVIKHFMEKYSEMKYIVYVYLAVVLLLFIMFYPVLSGLEVNRAYVDNFLQWYKNRWFF